MSDKKKKPGCYYRKKDEIQLITHRCCDCGALTPDHRCHACLMKWRAKHHVIITHEQDA